MNTRLILLSFFLFVLTYASGCGDTELAKYVYVNVVELKTDTQALGEQDDVNNGAQDHYEVLIIISGQNPINLFWSSRLSTKWDSFIEACASTFQQQCGVTLSIDVASPESFQDIIEASLMPPQAPRYHRIEADVGGSVNINARDPEHTIYDHVSFDRTFHTYKRRD